MSDINTLAKAEFITDSAFRIAPNRSYISANPGRATFQIPENFQLGDGFEISNKGGGFRVQTGPNQQLFLDGIASAMEGYIESLDVSAAIKVVCISQEAGITKFMVVYAESSFDIH